VPLETIQDVLDFLDAACEQAEPGKTFVAPMAARKGANLRTQMERIITKAGHAPWPRLFQNLRASRETDWVEKYPSHVVAKWLGHSPKVAAQHYLMSREHHFESVVTGGSAADTAVAMPAPAREQEALTASTAEPKAAAAVKGHGAEIAVAECDANCDARATHFATQQASAPDRTESHETTEPAAATRVTAGSSEVTPFTRNGEMAGTGFEPATSRL
jgi:hypothetical protein